MNNILIKVENLVKTFGGLVALNDCSLEIKDKAITGIIGPNGSGKTTLFNVITGNLKPDTGKVFYNGVEITNEESHDLFHLGVCNQKGERLLYSLMNSQKIKKEDELIKDKAMEVLKILKIEHLKNERAGNLSGGQKKLLELARTMMVDAKIVFLDEVGAGVNKTLLRDISDSILKLNQDKGYTFCMIEHDFNFISELCDPVIVLAEGSVLFKGSAEEVKSNEQVIESYLGKGLKK